MLVLSNHNGVPEYRDTGRGVLTSYSHARFLPRLAALGTPAYGPCAALAFFVDLRLRIQGLPLRGAGVDAAALYDSRLGAESPGMSFLEAFEVMATTGFRVGPATYYAGGCVRLRGARSLRAYIMTEGPALVTLRAAGRAKRYEAAVDVGYTAEGLELVGLPGGVLGPTGRGVLPWGNFRKIIEIWALIL